MRQAGISELTAALVPRCDLDGRGASSRGIRRDVERGVLHEVRRGWYIDAALWAELWPESRHRAHALAVAKSSRGAEPVLAFTSAAVLAWDLSLYRLAPTRVHVMLGERSRHSVPDVFRHEGALQDADVVEVSGIRCTSLERTVYDLARTVPAEAAISVVDAAMARFGGDPRAYDENAAEAWRERMLTRVGVRGARGIRRARELMDFADGRAQLPGESVSRLQLARIGFARPQLQVRVAGPASSDYWVDFALDDAGAFGEFDGAGKYLEIARATGVALEQVLLEEKQREDWIRGSTQRRFARWGSAHIVTPAALESRLASFHIFCR